MNINKLLKDGNFSAMKTHSRNNVDYSLFKKEPTTVKGKATVVVIRLVEILKINDSYAP